MQEVQEVQEPVPVHEKLRTKPKPKIPDLAPWTHGPRSTETPTQNNHMYVGSGSQVSHKF